MLHSTSPQVWTKNLTISVKFVIAWLKKDNSVYVMSWTTTPRWKEFFSERLTSSSFIHISVMVWFFRMELKHTFGQ